MSDLFHETIPDEYLRRVFDVMRKAAQHQFQVLTKRAGRMERFASRIRLPSNVWFGVSVESADYKWRIDHLRRVSARIRFLSLEPLLGPLGRLNLRGIHWVIVGGESGPGARTMETEWVREIQMQCETASIPFFFKQWGGVNKTRTGRTLNGRTYDDMPAGLPQSKSGAPVRSGQRALPI